jgi:diguanylate cyclase (GGDEF)-like protein
VRSSRERERLADELAAALERISELESEIERMSTRDQLAASLLSLRTFRGHLELDVRRAERFRRPLALALIDVDGFRGLNTRRGYSAGDEVLAAVGKLITAHTRSNDLASRMGADEFAVALHETSAPDAVPAMERVLGELEDVQAGGVRGITASIGIADLRHGWGPEQLLAAARTALDAAREAGGARVSLVPAQTVTAASEEPGDVASALASALEERDRYTGEHSESVVDLTASVAEALALDDDEVQRIRTAALLHDIGKIGIPDEILNKAGPLDDREWEVMRQHPVIGERIVRAIPGLGAIARIVRHEHERWDGGGYPDGLAEVEIPVGSRVILACDAYHAMVSDRPYRRAMSHTDAMSELTRNAGSQFDPDVIEALVGYLVGRRQSGLATI